MRRLFLVTGLLLAAGCTLEKGQPVGGDDGPGDGGGEGGEGGGGEGGGEDSGGGGGEDSGEGSEEELPDLIGTLQSDFCEGAGGYEDVAGATSFFVGTFVEEAGAWSGEEIWLLYANPAWEAAGGADCRVTWAISAVETTPGSCASCELALSISATLDPSSTDCSSELYSGDEDYDVDYDVDLAAERASVYFSSSGNLLGQGYGGQSAFNYATEPVCLWF